MRVLIGNRTEPAAVLLRAVCHELRPPLAILMSLTEALAEQSGEDGDLARLAGEHAAHAAAVLGQAAAAVEGLAAPAEPAQPLGSVLPAALAGVPADRLRLTVTRSAMAWPVRPRPVRQVLLNLLGNAVRHGAPGRTVAVRAEVRLRRLRLTVGNHGPVAHELFDALHRSAPPAGETGLGLWVVRQLVHATGGSLRARATRPEGLTVEVRLPAAV
ncbi:sensor histidine kinase [Actinoplanes sp. CA-030573]|uniref:sensor histidine kinase n=1 Tax=Actinoplanes sp. CA-030573 TaxID=3239898 RepID=UPI003D92A0EF